MTEPDVEIPLIEVDQAGPILLIEEAEDRLADLVRIARAHYGSRVVRVGDRMSRLWLVRTQNPYLPEIASIAQLAVPEGAFLLNLSFEWSCTVGLAPDPEGEGNRLLRTLDWPLEGLGRNVVVSRQDGGSGPYFNVTWPGFVGVLTAMAPSRFSAAINQPPMRRISGVAAVDWGLERLRWLSSRGLPPVHLLRRVFDGCRSFDEAQEMLCTTPLAMPAFFSLSGTKPEQCCIIQRTEHGARVHDGPGSIANHWLDKPGRGHQRGIDSAGRRGMMEGVRETTPGTDFSWVTSPILNPTLRLAAVANAATGSLVVRGYEENGPATRPFDLSAR